MTIPQGLKYTKEHEWLRVENDVAVVGITEFAAEALGDIVFVQLPAVGDTLKAGEVCGEIESTKSVSELYAPASGEVVEVNAALKDKPETVNKDPHASWMIVVRLTNPGEAGALLDATQYQDLVK